MTNQTAHTGRRRRSIEQGCKNLQAHQQRRIEWAKIVLRPILYYRAKGWTYRQIVELLKVVGVERFRGGTCWTDHNIANLIARHAATTQR